MAVLEVIQSAQAKRGISTAELSRRTGIGYEALRTSLKGDRGITASELVSLCKELCLDVDDFPVEPETVANSNTR